MKEPSTESVLAEIRAIAQAELDQTGPIDEMDRLVADLGIDSLGAIVLAVGLENHFRVRLQEQDAGTLATVGDLVRLVQKRCREAALA
jgi:acyl carrier protein